MGGVRYRHIDGVGRGPAITIGHLNDKAVSSDVIRRCIPYRRIVARTGYSRAAMNALRTDAPG